METWKVSIYICVFHFDICRKNCFLRYIGAYISFATPRTCFVAVENDSVGSQRQIMGMICAALDAKHFAEKVCEVISQMQDLLKYIGSWVSSFLIAV